MRANEIAQRATSSLDGARLARLGVKAKTTSRQNIPTPEWLHTPKASGPDALQNLFREGGGKKK